MEEVQFNAPSPAPHAEVTDARVEAGAKAYFRWFSSEGTSEEQRDIGRRQVRLILNAALAEPLTNNPVRVITDDHIDAFKLAFHGSYDGGRGENDYNKNIRLGLEAAAALIQTPPQTRAEI